MSLIFTTPPESGALPFYADPYTIDVSEQGSAERVLADAMRQDAEGANRQIRWTGGETLRHRDLRTRTLWKCFC